jgi:hypothetical protein
VGYLALSGAKKMARDSVRVSEARDVRQDRDVSSPPSVFFMVDIEV